ncbi:DUF6538 domain-containing protein [Aestuariivirga sp.]|uniref:DUF6538 domain-containing protein n=1 Tax=Aestuariivirga sp. TaxID=2650926 RepID=UPI003BA9C863
MARSGHLTKRKDTSNYQVQLRVPADLVPIIGKPHMRASLKTSDLAAAKKLARAVVTEWEAKFQDLRARREMTDGDLEAAAAEHWRKALEVDQNNRSRLPGAWDRETALQDIAARVTSGEISNDPLSVLNASLDYPVLLAPAAYDRDRRAILLKVLQQQTADGETVLIKAATDAYIAHHKLTVQPDTRDYRELAHRIARAEIDALKRTLERDKGDFTGTPTDPILSNVSGAPRDSTTFDTIIDRQVERNANGIGGRKKSASTIKKYKTVMQSFATWRGSARAATVTVQELEQWRDVLFTSKAQKSVRDYVAIVRTVLSWGHRQSKGGLFPKGFPLDLLELPAKPEVTTDGKAYTIAQAQKVLRAARKQKLGYLRWIPWLLCYSGARINEITPLERQDVFQVGEDWFIHIRPDDHDGDLTRQGRTTKGNKGRKVPVHPDLIDEGFITYVETITSGKLFPELRIDQNVRDWISRKGPMKGVKDAPAPAHGFRHLWEDLRRMKLDHGAALYIAGRSSGTSDDLYGKSNAMLPALAAEMQKFPSIMKIK